MPKNPLVLTLLLTAGLPVPASAQESPSAVVYYSPAWSPDSRTIAFESNRQGASSIYVIDPDGRNLRRLTPDGRDAYQPSWSPDGRRIVFTWKIDGRSQLFLMGADGSNPVQLTSAPGGPFFASFSPDGRSIVFGTQDSTRRDLYYVGVVRTDGSGYRILTDSTASSTGPHWSPDGRIIYSRTPMLPPRAGEAMRDLFRRRAEASTVVSIAPDGTDLKVMDGMSAEERDDPTPSPDGRFTVHAKEVNGVQGLYLVETATGRERLLVSGPASR